MYYFAEPFMKNSRKKYNLFHLASAIFMILALLWLTVSAPFVNAVQQNLTRQDKVENAVNLLSANEEESSTNPFGNNTEEKAPNGSNSFSEEYLHDHHAADDLIFIDQQFHKCDNAGTYIAFHGELHVPPPNVA